MNGLRRYSVCECVYTHTQWNISHKKNEKLPFAATRMDPENIILNEVSQRKTNILWYHLHVESKKKKYKWTYLQDRLTDIENKHDYQRGRNEV